MFVPKGKSCWILPLIEEVKEIKRGHEDALKLAKILIKQDTSWKHTHEPHAELTPVIMGAIPIFGDESGEERSPLIPSFKPWSREIIDSSSKSWSEDQLKEGSSLTRMTSFNKKQHDHYYDIEKGEPSYRISVPYSDEAPILLAARKGCIEIIEEILHEFPQAVHYLNRDQENVLHVAIKCRNLKIFKLVERGESPLRGLLGAVDNKNNSVLHMVGTPREVLPGTKMKSPVLQLSDDLRLLQVCFFFI